ncbi:Lysosomal-trafficking regulator [Halotydeus destructor]|nr:Lysosomal-trafficking regulator [Halotydeus destructor]
MDEKLLRYFWAKYVASPLNAKSNALDDFLNVFIVWVHDESASMSGASDNDGRQDKVYPTVFTDFLHSVGNILSHVFHSDVLEIGGSMMGDEDTEPIQRYFFVQKRGAKLLITLSKITSITQSVFSSKDEIANILIEILFLVSKFEEDSGNHDTTSISSYTNLTVPSVNKWQESFRTVTRLDLKPVTLKFYELKRLTSIKPALRKPRKYRKGVEPAFDSDDDDQMSANNREVGSLTDYGSLTDLEQLSGNQQTELEGKYREIADSCDLEVKQIQVSVTCICFAALGILNRTAYYEQRVFCLNSVHLYAFSKPVTSQNSLDVLSPLLEELIVSLRREVLSSTVACSATGVTQIERINLIDKLYRTVKALREVNDEEWEDLIVAVVHILIAVAQFLSETQEYAAMVRLNRVFITIAGREVTDLLTGEEYISLFAKLSDAIGQLVCSLQRAKILATHKEQCQKKKHSKCNLKTLMFHHSDLLGSQLSHSTFLRYPLCCISALSLMLVSSLGNLIDGSSISAVVDVLQTCGVCCCSSYSRLNNDLLEVASKATIDVKKKIFNLIETIWDNKKYFGCCKPEESANRAGPDNSGSDSAIHSDTSLLKDSQVKPWTASSHYRALLESESSECRHAVVKHLWTLCRLDCMSINLPLYQSVVLPLFTNSKSDEILENSLLLLCESLKRSSISKHFINIGGFSKLCAYLQKHQVPLLLSGAIETVLSNELKFSNDAKEMEENVTLKAFWSTLQDSSSAVVDYFRSVFKLTNGEQFESLSTSSTDNENNISMKDCLQSAVLAWEINSKLCQFSKDYCLAARNNVAVDAYNLLVCCANFLSKVDIDTYNSVTGGSVELFHSIFKLSMVSSLKFLPIEDSSSVSEDDLVDLIVSRLSASKVLFESNVLEIVLNCSLSVPEREKWNRPGMSNTSMLKISKKSDHVHSVSGVFSITESVLKEEYGYDADDEWCFGTNTRSRDIVGSIEPYPNRISHPRMCYSVLEILNELTNLPDTELIASHTYAVGKVFDAMIQMCEQDPENASILHASGVCSLLLDKFSLILKASNPKVSALQNLMLKLFLVISCHQVNGKEMKQFFNLFKNSSSPFEKLLRTLNTLLESCRDNPRSCLLFPSEPLLTSQIQESLTDAKKSWIINSKSSSSPDGLSTGWNEAGVLLPFTIRPALPKQLSATLWFSCSSLSLNGNLEKLQNYRRLMKTIGRNGSLEVHILSFAIARNSFELWFRTEDGKLILRRTSLFDSHTVSVLSELQTESHISLNGKWHFVYVNLTEVGSRAAPSVQFSVSIDNGNSESIVTDGVEFDFSPDPSLGMLLGSTKCSNVITQLSNLHLFQSALSRSQQTLMFYEKFGCETFTKKGQARSHNIPAYANDIDQASLYTNLNPEDIFLQLRSNAILSYNCDDKDVAIAYTQEDTSSGTFRILTRNFSISKPLSDIQAVRVIKLSMLSYKLNEGVHQAISETGGVDSGIFLFGKVIELCPEPQLQALALEAVFKITELNRSFRENFESSNGYDMINAALENSKAMPSKSMMDVYLKRVLSGTSYGTSFIRSVTALQAFFSAWKVWFQIENMAGEVFKVICELTDRRNPWRDINLTLLRRAHIFRATLNFLQVIFLGGEAEYLNKFSDGDARLLSKAIQSLLEFSEDLASFSELTDCLLLLHNASRSFVSFSKSSAYYIFPPNFETLTSRSNSDDSVSSFSEEWQVISSEIENHSETNIHCAIFGELLQCLTHVVVTSTPEFKVKIVGKILKFDYVLVWLNSDSERVRVNSIRLLLAILKTAPKELSSDFVNRHGFQLVASQLKPHPATRKLFNSFFCFILDTNVEDLYVQDSDLLRDWTQITSCQASAFVPLFSLLVSSCRDPSMCHDALLNLNKLIDELPYSSPVLKFIYDNGICECVANVLIEAESRSPREDVGTAGDDFVCDEALRVLYTLAYALFNSAGGIFFEAYNDMVDLFMCLKSSSSRRLEAIFQECVVVLFEAGFDCIAKHVTEARAQPKRRFSLITGLIHLDYTGLLTPRETDMSNYSSVSLHDPGQNTLSESESSVEMPDERPRPNVRILLPYNEAAARLRVTVSRSVDFFIHRDPAEEVWDREKFFGRTLLDSLTEIMTDVHEPGRTQLSSLYLPVKDALKKKWSEFLLFQLSPAQRASERKFVSKKLTSAALSDGLTLRLSAHQFNLAEAFVAEMYSSEVIDNDLKRKIQHLFRKGKSRRNWSPDHQLKEINVWKDRFEKARITYWNNVSGKTELMLSRLNWLYEKVRSEAMDVTKRVIESQNLERSNYLHLMKEHNRVQYSTRKCWKSLIRSLTHEKATWYEDKSFPTSWTLDPVEGPSRIRRRLTRCHLAIPSKFFLDEFKSKSKIPPPLEPLSYLFESNRFEIDSSAMIDHIHTNERISFITPASIVTPKEDLNGELLIGKSSIHFVGQHNDEDSGMKLIKELWPFSEIREVEERRYQLKNTAIELFLTNGSSYLIAFKSATDRQEFIAVLSSCPLPNVTESKSLSAVTQMWKDRTITNFDYLMYLNKAAGRSFNDLMQYPVFPFILSDYESDSLDFRNPRCFRDLSRPMAIQDKSKEQLYINQFNYLKNEFTRASQEVFMPVMAPFHYGSHYSNSGTVLHFLVRLPPFTQMFIQYQDRNFDIPDRTFHSMQTSWKLASGGSTTDFKELVPEFFYLPEFLQNNERFNFGMRQHNGIPVDHVALPLWCRGDARLFVFINRQAMESVHATEHLSEWIDLVFGYKQSGKSAEEAINVFHPATYFGVEVDNIEDPLRRKALETMIKTFGQMPRQLFTRPHISTSSKPEYSGGVPVTGEINGLKWGTYVGSPSQPEPAVLFRSNSLSKIEVLVPLMNNEVFGLPVNSCLHVSYSKQKKSISNDIYITSASIITWNHPDGVIRIKHQREQPAQPFLAINVGIDSVTYCACIPDTGLFFAGFKSGSVAIYALNDVLKPNTEPSQPTSWLYGHDGAVVSIVVNREFRTVITCGTDGTCISWDMNTFSYIRTLSQHEQAIDVCCASPTLGDIACCSSEKDGGSYLMCHTINASLICAFKTESRITAMTYSSCPEGISVNVLLTGFEDGTVRLWSSWDLTPVNVLKTDNFSRPVKCLAFSVDNNYLYAVNDEGTIVIWGKGQVRGSVQPTPVTLF